MATQEPDRGARRRWFRLPGSPSEPKEVAREEPEAQLSSDPMPADPTPTGDGGIGDFVSPQPAAPAPTPPAPAPDPTPTPPPATQPSSPAFEEPVATEPPTLF